ncbi:MAG: 3-hydroxyisobutyrate dehydrogenase [bacterium]
MTKKIAFIGIGNMGHPMAVNLKKASLNVEVFDLNPKAIEAAKKDNLIVAQDIHSAIKNADVIISMLPASQHVEDLYSKSIFPNAEPHSLLIDCSTIAPDAARRVQKIALSKGFEMIDAPVSGGTGAATAGTLTFMVGGEKALFEKAKPILEKMGKKIFYAGPSGCGQVAKVCNNMLLAIHMIGTSEALAMGKNLGLDPKVLSEIMLQSSGRNWSLEVYNPYPGAMENVPSSRDYSGGFGVQLMCKDLGLAAEAALSSKSKIPLGELARNLYEIHRTQGWAEKDFSSILKFISNE